MPINIGCTRSEASACVALLGFIASKVASTGLKIALAKML